MLQKSKLDSWNLHHQRVLLRADLNVPLNNHAHSGQLPTILNDFRLQAILPTIDTIQKKGGKVILITHIDRPEKPTPSLSTQILVPWFEKRGYSISFCPDLATAYESSLKNHATILLLENLRFFPGEQTDDNQFAQHLAKLGDYYVNDAFGTLHRRDTSITVVPKLFPSDKRSIGELVEKELTMLHALISNPKQPFVLIVGGGKVSDKIPLLDHLLDHVQDILLCPALVFTFLKAQGQEVGRSLVDDRSLEFCKTFLEKAKRNNVTVHFPLDYQIALDTLSGKLEIVNAQEFPNNGIGISIGPKTVELFAQKIYQAQTLFFNAAMGFENRIETLQGTLALIRAVEKSHAFSVIGGGESVAAAQNLPAGSKLHNKSTGGGATMAFLGGQKLPGLEALE